MIESRGKHRHLISRINFCVLGLLCCVGLVIGSVSEAKKRRGRSSLSLKILQVTTSSSPFEIGNGELTFSTIVKVPNNLNGLDVLEVTALITSSTQRSMRFLAQRVPLGSKAPAKKGPRISTILVWDGKDQTQTLVEPGMYQYEVRAKLMAEKDTGIRTRVISRRSRGTVEVTKYTIPDLPAVVEDPLQNPETNADSSLAGDQEEIIPEEILPEGPVEAATDEVEMLPDESTSHPVPEPGDEDATSEDGEVLEIPQVD